MSRLEDQSRPFRLLISPRASFSLEQVSKGDFMAYPSSKCLHRLSASWAFVLQAVHSNLSTIFLVVFAFLWKTGLVWPP